MTVRFREIFSSFILLALVACGGGGGGSSAAQPSGSVTPNTLTSSSSLSQSPSTENYSYEKILGDYTGKSWSAFSTGRSVNYSELPLVAHDSPDSFSVTQNSNSYDIRLTGSFGNTTEDYNYDFSVSETNSTVRYLFDPNGVQMMVSAVRSFSDATMRLITYDLDYLAGLGNEYVNSGWVQIERADNRTDIFPAIYGSVTEEGDLQSSGVKTYQITPHLFIERWAQASSDTTKALAAGTGQVSVNFGDNSLEASITLERYYDYDQFLVSGSDYSQLLGLGQITISITDGQFNPSNSYFQATMSINQENQDGTTIVAGGAMGGYLYGHDGDEIAGSFSMARDADAEQSELWFWDSVGSFIGR